jgi:hypothetical protein
MESKMQITKNIPVTIEVDDDNLLACNGLCDNFIDDKCKDYFYCHYGRCDLETIDDNTLRCKQCITDFGAGNGNTNK